MGENRMNELKKKFLENIKGNPFIINTIDENSSDGDIKREIFSSFMSLHILTSPIENLPEIKKAIVQALISTSTIVIDKEKKKMNITNNTHPYYAIFDLFQVSYNDLEKMGAKIANGVFKKAKNVLFPKNLLKFKFAYPLLKEVASNKADLLIKLVLSMQ